jgi:site-specific DNA-methyltransferase (adenine-specific)
MMHENAYLLAKGYPQKPEYPPQDVLIWEFSGNKLHPTQKPVTAIVPLIEAYSKPNEIVLDPFGGSGTTGIAARQCKRQFILFEKDWQYYQVARERLEHNQK